MVMDVLQNMYEADNKDITFILKDGSEKSRSAVLKSMLSYDMKEKKGTIELTDVSVVAMRVFLRLLYTGSVCEDDWARHEENLQAADPCTQDDVSAAPPLD